jgi:hypothetical protein
MPLKKSEVVRVVVVRTCKELLVLLTQVWIRL